MGLAIYIYNFIFLTITLILCQIKVFPKKWYRPISIFYFLFVLGQRWEAGVDFYAYLKYYLIGFKTEIGYRLIQDFFYKNNLYFGLFIFCIYCFTTLVSLWFLNKFTSSNYSIYFFFLSEYHIMSINPIRTYIAINIILILIFKILKEKRIFLKTLVYVFYGCLFHQITLYIIPFILVFIKCKKRIKIEKIVIFMLFILPFLPWLKLLREILFHINILGKYINYIGSSYDIGLSNLNIIRYYVVLILCLYLKKEIEKIGENCIFIKIGMYNFLFLSCLSVQLALLHRLAYFFKIFEIIYFGLAFEITKKKTKKLLIIAFFLLNYVGIVYKDTGILAFYRLEILQLKNSKTKNEYFEEIDKELYKWKKILKGAVTRKRN